MLQSACTAHVSLSLFDLASEDDLPLPLRVFALRMLMWLVDHHGDVVSPQIAAYSGPDGLESLLMKSVPQSALVLVWQGIAYSGRRSMVVCLFFA